MEPDGFFWMLLDGSNLLVVSNSATTFVIYWLFSQRYRRIFQLTFRHCLPARCLPSPEVRKVLLAWRCRLFPLSQVEVRKSSLASAQPIVVLLQ